MQETKNLLPADFDEMRELCKANNKPMGLITRYVSKIPSLRTEGCLFQSPNDMHIFSESEEK
jgi:hypothetical protein